jgi:hypothetical protein
MELRSIDLSKCGKVTARGVSLIASYCTKLTSINLSYVQVYKYCVVFRYSVFSKSLHFTSNRRWSTAEMLTLYKNKKIKSLNSIYLPPNTS